MVGGGPRRWWWLRGGSGGLVGGGGGGGCTDSGCEGEVSGGGSEVFDHVGTAAHKSGVQGLVEDDKKSLI